MTNVLDLHTEIELAEILQTHLVAQATNGGADNEEYCLIRQHFIKNAITKNLLPSFVRTSRDLAQFWHFIKYKFPTYAERRQFIWKELHALLDYLERTSGTPSDSVISMELKTFDESGVHAIWQRAVERRTSDPEGAITIARTLLETVCKHILDSEGTPYGKKIELPELYKLTSEKLNISPSQHTEEIFKQILGGCSGIVSGLGQLRNALSDAHGKGKKYVRPGARHAELAVNLAGSVSLFLIRTYQK